MVLRFLVLGLLSVQPMTGYDLKRAFDHSVRHFWAADRSQLYRTLAALVAAGHADVEVVAQESYPDRKVHHITPAGRVALRDWLASPLEVEDQRDPFLGRVFFGDALDDDALADLFAARRRQAEAMLEALTAEDARVTAELAAQAAGAPADRGLALRLATLRSGLAHARTELAWLDETAREVLP
ncbi:PadR family transcriptional regulator [Isoptericola dokdonensis]|jgi:DNA-binding PadR family transcriptional regulator|uniref:Transcriptional regulator PadR-like family protein n=1 Tax=Isoptericola dokdonensis DS-3 TaxID=1300344 RepID=A0A161I6K0_9MICO|nr:PadR family transcriptional regulator [Isoptericola dokdonensis]ANC31078.1 Transcriptional regulator PadR-like family protein [Isoptericola dokdonensis DS-3]